MDENYTLLVQKLSALESKIDALYVSSEKMRKYFLWTLIITVALIALPLLVLPLVLPLFLQTLALPVGF